MRDFNRYGTRLGQPGLERRDHTGAGAFMTNQAETIDEAVARTRWWLRSLRAVMFFQGAL